MLLGECCSSRTHLYDGNLPFVSLIYVMYSFHRSMFKILIKQRWNS